MARRAIYFSQLTHEQMNSGDGYRVALSYGTFTLAAKVTQSGVYYYVYKRVAGKLHKAYVGKCGDVTKDDVHQATMRLAAKYEWGGRDNIGRQ